MKAGRPVPGDLVKFDAAYLRRVGLANLGWVGIVIMDVVGDLRVMWSHRDGTVAIGTITQHHTVKVVDHGS